MENISDWSCNRVSKELNNALFCDLDVYFRDFYSSYETVFFKNINFGIFWGHKNTFTFANLFSVFLYYIMPPFSTLLRLSPEKFDSGRKFALFNTLYDFEPTTPQRRRDRTYLINCFSSIQSMLVFVIPTLFFAI